jgi:hypothetical protein
MAMWTRKCHKLGPCSLTPPEGFRARESGRGESTVLARLIPVPGSEEGLLVDGNVGFYFSKF